MSLMINGAKYAIATVLSVPSAITAITNAAPPVASAVAPPADGSILLISSGWGELTDAVARSIAAAADSFSLEGYDSTDETRYPVGEGAGAFQIASAFVNLPKIHDITSSGGDQNYATRQYVDDPSSKQVQAPTFKSAQSRTFMMDYDPTKAHFAALVELDRKRELVVLRETLPNGDIIYSAGRVSFNKEPTRALNEFMSNQMTFSLGADSIRYNAPV